MRSFREKISNVINGTERNSSAIRKKATALYTGNGYKEAQMSFTLFRYDRQIGGAHDNGDAFHLVAPSLFHARECMTSSA
jgi:hypothetical protein